MTLEQLENLMGRAGLTQHQTRELLPAIHAYATDQCATAIELVGPVPVHYLDIRHFAHVACGQKNENLVNTTNTRLVNCPDCLKAGAG